MTTDLQFLENYYGIKRDRKPSWSKVSPPTDGKCACGSLLAGCYKGAQCGACAGYVSKNQDGHEVSTETSGAPTEAWCQQL